MIGCTLRSKAPQGQKQRQGEQHEAERDEKKTLRLRFSVLTRTGAGGATNACSRSTMRCATFGHDDCARLVRFREHDAVEAGVLHKDITTWATSLGVSPWLMPRSNKSILFRHLGEQVIEPLVEHLEPRHFRVTQVDDDAGAIGGLD